MDFATLLRQVQQLTPHLIWRIPQGEQCLPVNAFLATHRDYQERPAQIDFCTGVPAPGPVTYDIVFAIAIITTQDGRRVRVPCVATPKEDPA